MADVDCRATEELLPWFVQGTLSAAEQGEVERHLAGCARCREVLVATREAAALYASHPPTEAIVDYALGLPVAGLDRSVLESHLAHCAECREERRLVEAEHASSALAPIASMAPMAPMAPIGQMEHSNARQQVVLRGRAIALAASLAAVSALSVWFAMRDRAPLPEGRVAFVELLPESRRTRGAESGRSAVDRTRTTTLLLVTDRGETFDDVRVTIRSLPGGATLWGESGLTPAAAGAYALVLPAAALPAGEWEIVLEGRLATDWSEIARYRVALEP
jgi:anti-sigma factor RsiW